MDWVQEQVVHDLENRVKLVERFELSQSIYNHDPWERHVKEQAEKYAPIADLTLEAAE